MGEKFMEKVRRQHYVPRMYLKRFGYGNIGDEYRIYEAVHGSAPDIAGKGIANPSALLLAFALMLEALGKLEDANKLRNALAAVVEEGVTVTPDIGGSASTAEFTAAIIRKLG